ncbi:uncharacterized protein N7511_000431 [Penicillium nucicola]|uniref:uncharacterized protein n=1 Tax=Penicillium nucicola TaxID=1850975 RepID=UPI0025455FDF|nr:uncharacterized protein N7511_000431 [Penicillium nucicola]KAJ5775420.1 hypothetical protein N7511_000431 [Penicillium nucicola]
MRLAEDWFLSTGRALLVLSSIIKFTSGAAIGSSAVNSSSIYKSSSSKSFRTSSEQSTSSIDPSSSSLSSSTAKHPTVIVSSSSVPYGFGSSSSNVVSTSSSKSLIGTGNIAQSTDSSVSSTVPVTSQPTSTPSSRSNAVSSVSSTSQPSSIESAPNTGSSIQSSSHTRSLISSASSTVTSGTGLDVSSIPPSSSGSSKSLSPLGTNSGGPSIISSTIVESGSTIAVPIITGGTYSAPITLPPATSTIQSSEASSSASLLSSDIVGLIPIISSWKKNPDPLKTEALDHVKEIQGKVEGLISDLGSPSSSSGCGSKKKKRGLFDSIGNLVNSLSCIDEDLNKVKDDISTNNVDSLDATIDELTQNNDNLTENDNEDNSESNSNSDSSTTTSSSCTDLSTAFKVTIKCVPTSFITGSSTLPTTTCTPSTTVTTVGCSVTGLTTTISTSASATGTQIPCASDTCGNACPMNKGPLSGASMGVIATTENCALISTSTTATLPTGSYGVAGSIGVTAPTQSSSASKRSPSNSDDNHLVDRSLVERALSDVSPPYADYIRSLTPVWVSQLGDASGQWFDFPAFGHSAAGVNGIYGCTAVIITSEKGVYISHIWEVPVFIHEDYSPTDDGYFVTAAFNSLRDGTSFAQSVTGLIGTDQNPGVLNAIYAPKVFVLTPYTTEFDRQMFGISTKLRYQDRANDLAQRLANAIPGSGAQGTVMGYTRTSQQASTQEPGVAGRAILEVDPFQTWLTSENDPNSAGLQVGRWRLWVEDQLITYQDFWLPHAEVSAGTLQKRDGGSELLIHAKIVIFIQFFGISIIHRINFVVIHRLIFHAIFRSELLIHAKLVIFIQFFGISIIHRISFLGRTSLIFRNNLGASHICTKPKFNSTYSKFVYYTTFPSSITPKSSATQAPTTATPEPIVKTEDGNIISYPSRTIEYGEVYGKQYTFTNGAGSPVTLETAAPTQTDVNNKGSSQCSSVDDACQRAYEQFEDDTVYSDFASYTAKIQSGMVMVASFGQAGCVAQYKCDDYGFGMTGRQIKDAVEYMKDNDGIKKCGTTYLSNSCHVTLNYCTSCKAQH